MYLGGLKKLGIKPITTDKFNIVWKRIWNVKPKAKYLVNNLSDFNAILIPRYNKKPNKKDIDWKRFSYCCVLLPF